MVWRFGDSCFLLSASLWYQAISVNWIWKEIDSPNLQAKSCWGFWFHLIQLSHHRFVQYRRGLLIDSLFWSNDSSFFEQLMANSAFTDKIAELDFLLHKDSVTTVSAEFCVIGHGRLYSGNQGLYSNLPYVGYLVYTVYWRKYSISLQTH